MKNPTATIYQNENDVIVIFSALKDKNGITEYRGASVSFENRWMDGGACGLAGFENKKELDKFLNESKFIKKGTLKLGEYCYAKYTIKNGATLTCNKKLNHKNKHEADYTISFGDDRENGNYKW